MTSLKEIVIVDDHEIFRDGLSSLITLKKMGKVVALASNGKEFLEVLKVVNPDLILMDIAMPEMDGVTATQKAIEKYPKLNILALSMFGDEDYYFKMINAGVKGFLLKSSANDELEQAIQVVSNGGNYFSNELLRKALLRFSKGNTNTPKEEFTEREIEILTLLCKGLSALEIADELHLSKKTIEGHRTKLFSKTGTKNSVSLVIYAIKNNIIEV